MTEDQTIVKALIERYPFLAPYNVFTGELDEDYDYSYIFPLEIPRGWNKLFLQLCEDIRQPLIDAGCLDSFRLLQVKEKYNRLEVYNSGAPDTVQEIIDKYTEMAQYICVNCGRPAEYETSGYIASYCIECFKDYVRHEKGDWIKFNPTYTFKRWINNAWEEYTISFEDEWNRYLTELKNNKITFRTIV